MRLQVRSYLITQSRKVAAYASKDGGRQDDRRILLNVRPQGNETWILSTGEIFQWDRLHKLNKDGRRMISAQIMLIRFSENEMKKDRSGLCAIRYWGSPEDGYGTGISIDYALQAEAFDQFEMRLLAGIVPHRVQVSRVRELGDDTPVRFGSAGDGSVKEWDIAKGRELPLEGIEFVYRGGDLSEDELEFGEALPIADTQQGSPGKLLQRLTIIMWLLVLIAVLIVFRR